MMQVGEIVPSVVLQTLDGVEAPLANLRGKRRLLYMWGSW